jgi:hypothetical protein
MPLNLIVHIFAEGHEALNEITSQAAQANDRVLVKGAQLRGSHGL